MAHRLLEEQIIERPPRKRFSLGAIQGRFGLAFYVGGKEIFLGIALADIAEEKIVRMRRIKTKPATTQVLRFDPMS